MKKLKKQLFGSRVKDLREEMGFSEIQTAELTDMDISRLRDIENSKIIDLNVTEILLFAKLFQMDVARLVSKTEQEELTNLSEKLGKKPSNAQIEEIKIKYSK